MTVVRPGAFPGETKELDMTRKDYVAIARVIVDAQFINCPTEAEMAMNAATRGKIAYQLADLMGRDNPRFDGARFLKACGI